MRIAPAEELESTAEELKSSGGGTESYLGCLMRLSINVFVMNDITVRDIDDI